MFGSKNRFNTRLIPIALLIIVFYSGCGKSDPLAEETPFAFGPNLLENTDTPEGTAKEFLQSAFTGNEKMTHELLSRKAKLAKSEFGGLPFNPPNSVKAKFKIVQVDLNGDEIAHVETVLIDYDELENELVHPPIYWALRRTEDGWRVAGAAVVQYEGMAPIIMNFESAEEMKLAINQAIQQEEARIEQEKIAKAEKEYKNIRQMDGHYVPRPNSTPPPSTATEIPIYR